MPDTAYVGGCRGPPLGPWKEWKQLFHATTNGVSGPSFRPTRRPEERVEVWQEAVEEAEGTPYSASYLEGCSFRQSGFRCEVFSETQTP